MKRYIIIILLIITSSFILDNRNENIPSDLRKSSVIIIVRSFDDWKKTISGNPKGYDDYAKNIMFENYNETINGLEKLFNEYQMKISKQAFSDTTKNISADYLIDYRINCTGGDKERDWWTCLGGFYFKEVKSGKEFEELGTDNRIIKQLKKAINNSK